MPHPSSLHICTSRSWGGLELYVGTLIHALAQAGAPVLVICEQGSPLEDFLTTRGIQVLHMPAPGAPALRSVRFLRNLLHERRVDVVHVHFHKDIWNASLALWGDAHRKLFLSIYMGVGRKRDLLHRFIYRRVDAAMSSSVDLNEKLARVYPIPASRILYLPYGRDLSFFQRNETKRKQVRAEWGVGDEELIVGTALRIDPGKGVMDFVKSYSSLGNELLPRVHYLIVGEPTRKARHTPQESPFEDHCVAYLRELEVYKATQPNGSRIIFTGYREDIVNVLSAFDVFVFPSRDELYSIVVLEAMAMGLPVVAARAGGNIRQIEDERRGLLYNVGDSLDLAAKIRRYLADSGLRKAHGEAARAFVEREHDMNKTLNQLLGLYAAERTRS